MKQLNLIKDCIACQSTNQYEQRAPLCMSEPPSGPFSELSMHFANLPNGKYLMCIMDDYSRFPFVEVINSKCSSTVIPQLDNVTKGHSKHHKI
jgi:hypothetical protein